MPKTEQIDTLGALVSHIELNKSLTPRKTEQIGTKMDPPFLLMNPLGKWTKMHAFSLTPGTDGFCMISMKIRLFPAVMKKHRILMKSGADRAKIGQKITTSRAFVKAIWRKSSAQN